MEIFEAGGQFYDGKSAKPHQASVKISEEGVDFRLGRKTFHWAMDDLRALNDQAKAGGISLHHVDDTAARLHIPDMAAARFLRSLPNNLDKRQVSGKMKRRVALWATGAIVSVLVILFVLIPAMSNTLARFIPQEREAALGKYTLGQIAWFLDGDEETLACRNEKGLAALEKMTARLRPHFETDYTNIEVQVFNHEMVNAFAVPGAQIVLFDGLIESASSPEEVAGVLAHELGHVVNRDPTRLSLRTAGSAGILGMVFGDFAGGFAALALAEAFLSASYSQEAEELADEFSHDVFARAGLPSASFATFFTTLQEKYNLDDDDGILSHFASHPDIGGRRDAAIAADTVGDKDFEPVLTKAEWADLKAICPPRKKE